LARAQSQAIATALERAHTGLRVEVVIYKTKGDRVLDRPLHEIGGKGLFTKEIEEDLIAGKIDFIVHSCKDVPVTMPLVDQQNLVIGAIPLREDPRDAIVSRIAGGIVELPSGARVGTGSLRRRCQLLAARPDLNVELLRGNVDTRVRKALDGTFDAVILAMAGLKRSGFYNVTYMSPIATEQMLPSAGQGALLLQCRDDDSTARNVLAVLNNPATAEAVHVERSIVEALNGDCQSPIAVLAEPHSQGLRLRAAVGARGGSLPIIRAAGSGGCVNVVHQVVTSLLNEGALDLLGSSQPAGAN
jgi:hydroxymethylbilane synthase